jgi:hypothetical protein
MHFWPFWPAPCQTTWLLSLSYLGQCTIAISSTRPMGISCTVSNHNKSFRMNCLRGEWEHQTLLLMGNNSLVSKRNKWVNASGAAGRDVAGQQGHKHEKQRHGPESHWIVSTYAE